MKIIKFLTKSRHYHPSKSRSLENPNVSRSNEKNKLKKSLSTSNIKNIIQVENIEPRQMLLRLEKACSSDALYIKLENNDGNNNTDDKKNTNNSYNNNNNNNNNEALNTTELKQEDLYATVSKKKDAFNNNISSGHNPTSYTQVTSYDRQRVNSYTPKADGNTTQVKAAPKKKLQSQFSVGNTQLIELYKNKPSIGISISGGNSRSIKITALHPGGAADGSNLKVGQNILSVDGKSLLNVTHEEAVDLIRSSYYNNESKKIEFMVN